jgi:hypothetical protein
MQIRAAAALASLFLACAVLGAVSEPKLGSADILSEAEAMQERLVEW